MRSEACHCSASTPRTSILPKTVPLEQLYTRALQILGVQSPGAQPTELSLGVIPVSILSDVSDVSVPHQNPIYGVLLLQPAVALENAQCVLQATAQMIRIRQIFVSSGTDVRVAATPGAGGIPHTTTTGTITAAAIGTLGPFGTPATSTAIASTGRSVGAQLPASSWAPEQVQFDVRPQMLLAPGEFLAFEDTAVNTTVTVSIIWEEIPLQLQTISTGFPA